MASRDLEDLIPEMRERAEHVTAYCASQGVSILVTCTARTLEEQAILYRRSRDYPTIRRKIDELEELGYDFAARILNDVGSQGSRPKATDAAPAESWHNYLEALDSVPIVCGKPLWETHDVNDELYPQWRIYGEAAAREKLMWLGKTTNDFGHIQMRDSHNPLRLFTPEQARAILEERGMLI